MTTIQTNYPYIPVNNYATKEESKKLFEEYLKKTSLKKEGVKK